jgi:hypothetical protein
VHRLDHGELVELLVHAPGEEPRQA